MKKIEFKNNDAPYLSAENFNQMQDNIEEAIEEQSTYSTKEQVIGIWKDGKLIYRKVVEFTTALVSGDNTINISTPNIDKLIRGDLSQKGQNYTFPYFTTAGKFTFLQNVASNYINIRTNDSWSSNTWELILEYTKTTD